MGVSIVLWRLLLCLLGGFLWVFLGFLCGLAGLFLCILPVYLGVPYAFFNEILVLIKKNVISKEPFGSMSKQECTSIILRADTSWLLRLLEALSQLE
jgi:hypothetical protein